MLHAPPELLQSMDEIRDDQSSQYVCGRNQSLYEPSLFFINSLEPNSPGVKVHYLCFFLSINLYLRLLSSSSWCLSFSVCLNPIPSISCFPISLFISSFPQVLCLGPPIYQICRNPPLFLLSACTSSSLCLRGP